MKTLKYLLLIGMIAALISACGSTDEKEQTVTDNQQGVVEEDTSAQDTSKKKREYLLGVYEYASEYINFPMGTYFDGEQKGFCSVKIPEKYIANATYIDEEGNEQIHDKIYGVLTENIDLSDNEVATQRIILRNGEGTVVNFAIIPTSTNSMEDEKEYAGEYKELNLTGNEAIYYAGKSTSGDETLNVTFQINDDVMLYIGYEGPALDDLGEDQLAENIYNLIEVIE